MKCVNYVCFVFLSTNLGAFAITTWKSCTDCIDIDGCDWAVNFKENTNITQYINQVRYAHCGDGIITKVCCSYFNTDKVETHRNIGLLPNNCGTAFDENRISGGEVASIFEFPWMALISYQTKRKQDFGCAGSIINSLYILTAAHCIKNSKEISGVRIGELDISSDNDCPPMPAGRTICKAPIQDIPVNDTKCHEDYDATTYAFDIGVIRLSQHIDFTYKNAAPICLPTSRKLRSVSLSNERGIVTGWGLTEEQKYSSKLRKVTISLRPFEECFQIYDRYLQSRLLNEEPKQFCAGDKEKDSCKGDSGGPLIIKDSYTKSTKYIQYGIISQGPNSCGSELPAIYIAVSPYMEWILDQLKP